MHCGTDRLHVSTPLESSSIVSEEIEVTAFIPSSNGGWGKEGSFTEINFCLGAIITETRRV